MSHRADTAVPVPSERHVLPGSKKIKCALADGSLYLFIDLNTKQKQTIAGHSSESNSLSRPFGRLSEQLTIGFAHFFKTSLKADSVGGRGSGALPFSEIFF